MCDLYDCEKSADVGTGGTSQGTGYDSEDCCRYLDDDFKGLLVHGGIYNFSAKLVFFGIGAKLRWGSGGGADAKRTHCDLLFYLTFRGAVSIVS